MLSSVPVLMRITIVTGSTDVRTVLVMILITTLSFGPSVSFASIGNVVVVEPFFPAAVVEVVDAAVEAEPAGAVVATVDDDVDPDDPAIVEEVEDEDPAVVDDVDEAGAVVDDEVEDVDDPDATVVVVPLEAGAVVVDPAALVGAVVDVDGAAP